MRSLIGTPINNININIKNKIKNKSCAYSKIYNNDVNIVQSEFIKNIWFNLPLHNACPINCDGINDPIKFIKSLEECKTLSVLFTSNHSSDKIILNKNNEYQENTVLIEFPNYDVFLNNKIVLFEVQLKPNMTEIEIYNTIIDFLEELHLLQRTTHSEEIINNSSSHILTSHNHDASDIDDDIFGFDKYYGIYFGDTVCDKKEDTLSRR